MGLLDREWFVEDHKRREEEYGGDFSLDSKKVSSNKNTKAMPELSPIEEELKRIRKERADNNKAAIAVGVLSLIFAVFCFFGGISPGTWTPIIAGLINLAMFALAEDRRRKDGDKTDLNKWARYVTITATIAMLLLDRM